MQTVQPSLDPQNVESDQGLHCMLIGLSMQNSIKFKQSLEMSKNRIALIQMMSGQVHWSKSVVDQNVKHQRNQTCDD